MSVVAEDRKVLQPYLNKRILVSGLYSRHDLWTDQHTRREYRTVCLTRVEDQSGNMLADHVWIHRANKLLEYKPQYGERITLTALVIQYKDKEGIVKYHLDVPEEVDWPDRNGIAIRIPEPKPETPKTETPRPMKIEEPKLDSVALLLRVKTFADEVGGLARVEEAIAMLKQLRA